MNTLYKQALENLAKTPIPSDADLRRMYELIQADARLTKRLNGLGFHGNGDAYRMAAAKLKVYELLNLLRDGKNIRNDVVHKPGYIPSAQSTDRALAEYAGADAGLDRALSASSNA